MRIASRRYLRRSARPLVAGLLCVVLAEGPLLAAVADKPKAAANAGESRGQDNRSGQDRGDDRILQALNRLTFGPRPGDVAAVKAMGLQKWIDQQLSPESIDDSALDARLAMYPAMQLTVPELIRKFPSNQQIKQIADGRGSLPADPEERAIYANALARYQANQEKQAALAKAGTADSAAGGQQGMGPAMADGAGGAGSPSMKAHEEKMYADLEATEVINLPPDKRMARLISMRPDEIMQFGKGLPPDERADLVRDLTPQQKETALALINPRQVVAGELMQAKLVRAIYSDRQLQEVMTDFWLNHFNIYIKKGPLAPYYLTAYERDVIRPRALGKFEDLLVATAQSPAMLFYLDNFSSIGPDSLAAQRAKQRAEFNADLKAKGAADRGLNENYGRELMELHTLGVTGGYTQKDVTEVAKVFTGWTLDKPYQGGGGGFIFDANRHEPVPKVVLGRKIAEGGENEGLEVLHMLATSPKTAHFVSSEIATRFVGDTPPPALVDRMAQAWLASDGDIRTVLKTMIDSPEFWSKGVYRAKFKTPLEYVVSAARASGAEVRNAQPLVAAMDKLGMPLYGCQPPTGYADTADAWLSTEALVNRMNFSVGFAANQMPGVRTDWSAELGGAGTPERVEKRLEGVLLDGPAGEHTRQAVLSQTQTVPFGAAETSLGVAPPQGPQFVRAAETDQNPPATAEERQAGLMAGMLLGSPEFQRR